MEGRITKARREEKEGRKQLERIRDVLDTLEPESGSMDKDAILKGQGKVDDMRAFLNKIVRDAPSLDVSDVQAALDAADRSWDSVTPEEPALPEAHTAEFTKYWSEKLNAVELEKGQKVPEVPGYTREKAVALLTEEEKVMSKTTPALSTWDSFELWLRKLWVRKEAKEPVPEPAEPEPAEPEDPAEEEEKTPKPVSASEIVTPKPTGPAVPTSALDKLTAMLRPQTKLRKLRKETEGEIELTTGGSRPSSPERGKREEKEAPDTWYQDISRIEDQLEKADNIEDLDKLRNSLRGFSTRSSDQNQQLERLDKAIKHKQAVIINPKLPELEKILNFEVIPSGKLPEEILEAMTQKAEEQSKITTLWIEKHKPQKAKLEEQFRKFLRAEGLDDTAESFNEWVVRLSPAQTKGMLISQIVDRSAIPLGFLEQLDPKSIFELFAGNVSDEILEGHILQYFQQLVHETPLKKSPGDEEGWSGEQKKIYEALKHKPQPSYDPVTKDKKFKRDYTKWLVGTLRRGVAHERLTKSLQKIVDNSPEMSAAYGKSWTALKMTRAPDDEVSISSKGSGTSRGSRGRALKAPSASPGPPGPHGWIDFAQDPPHSRIPQIAKFGGGPGGWPDPPRSGSSIPYSAISGMSWRSGRIGRRLPPVPSLRYRREPRPLRRAATQIFGGITSRLAERDPLKYQLTRGPSERRIQLSSGHMMVNTQSIEILLAKKPLPEDRKLISAVITTKFKMGGKIDLKQYSSAILEKQVWKDLPGKVKIFV